MKTKPRILIWDIENLPNKGYFFNVWTGVGHNLQFITKTHAIICIAYKFYGEDEQGVISVADFPEAYAEDPYNDRHVIEKFIKEILPKADYVVAHYGDKHDSPMLAARCLMNGIEPPPLRQTIDTYKLVKKHFKLNTNKLDHISYLLGIGNKTKMDAGDWVGCAEGDVEAVKKMASYNLRDVLLLEKVFERILPYVTTKLHIEQNKETGERRCPSCGNTNLQKNGYYYTKLNKKLVLQCSDCKTHLSVTIDK